MIIFHLLYIYSCGSLLSVQTVNSTVRLYPVDKVTETSLPPPLYVAAFREQNKYIHVQEKFSILTKFMRSWKNIVALWGVSLVNPLSFLFVTCLLTYCSASYWVPQFFSIDRVYMRNTCEREGREGASFFYLHANKRL